MDEIDIEREIRYGLPVFKDELRVSQYDDDKVKEILRDKRTHILATCMAAYPFTPTKELAKEFGIKAKTINALAKMYGIKKSDAVRSTINSENGKKCTHRTPPTPGKIVEKIARNGRVVAVFKSAHEAAKAIGVDATRISYRCTGRIKKALDGFRYRYKKDD